MTFNMSEGLVACVPTRLVVLQPTTYCNLDCSYCYLPLTSLRRRMDLETVAAIGRFLAQLEAHELPLTISWHSGEPLTVGPAFYRAAFETLQSTPGCPDLRHSVQTNGTLIDDRWCELFAQWEVQVGLSLDGPEWIHDACRVDRRGSGTFHRVMRGARKLRDHGLNPSVIAVLSESSLQHPDEVWGALVAAGFGAIAFNVQEAEGANPLSHRSFSADVCRSYEEFLLRIHELRGSRPEIHVRELDDMHRFLSSPSQQDVRSIENLPGAIISISYCGDISTFSPELLDLTHERYRDFRYGNVHRSSWLDVRRNVHFRLVAKAIANGVERCQRECEYFAVCGGGAPSNKLGEHDTFESTETLDCRLRVQAVAETYLRTLGV